MRFDENFYDDPMAELGIEINRDIAGILGQV